MEPIDDVVKQGEVSSMTHDAMPVWRGRDVIYHHQLLKLPSLLRFLFLTTSLICLPDPIFIMPRANDNVSKVFYKGRSEDFTVFVDDLNILQQWKNDRSIALANVLNGWKIFVSHQ